MSTMPGVVDDIREFNRFYTRVLGLLQPDLAGSAFEVLGDAVPVELLLRKRLKNEEVENATW